MRLVVPGKAAEIHIIEGKMGYVSWSDKNKIFFVFVFVVDKEGKCDETGEKRGVINTFVFVFVVYKGGP
jgi:hypothetical protein